jgi:hypothetical protein
VAIFDAGSVKVASGSRNQQPVTTSVVLTGFFMEPRVRRVDHVNLKLSPA